MKIMLKVDYTDNTGKYWQDSYIKNTIVNIENNENIHDKIAEVIKENDGVVLSYKNKPMTNVFIDDKNGNAKAVGYIYRGKTEIQNEKYEWKKALFDVWVVIKKVDDFPIKVID